MNKKKKVFISVFSIIVFVVLVLVCAVFIFKANYYTADMSKAMDAKTYLSEKYSIPKSELELKEYIPAKRFIMEDEFGFDHVSRPLWVYEYNGTDITVSANFTVNYRFVIVPHSIENVHYVDDYDLEHIYNLGLEYLKKNVDKNIFAYTFNTDDLERYYVKYNNYLSDENIENFLSVCECSIYIFSENPTKAKEVFKEKGLINKIPDSQRIPNVSTKSVYFLDEVIDVEYYSNITDNLTVPFYKLGAGYKINYNFFTSENFAKGHIVQLDN